MLLDSCASGGRRIDLEVLSRAVILSRSDYEFGSAPGKCKLPAAGFPGDNTGDFEAEQSQTMGSFLVGAIPYGSPLRHYHPYATRSAGPAAKTVDWGIADWQEVSKNTTAQAIIEGAHAESRLMREYILSENDFYALNGSNPSPDIWAAYQVHRTQQGDGYMVAFRRCNAVAASFRAQLRGLDSTTSYTLSLREKAMPLPLRKRRGCKPADVWNCMCTAFRN